MAALFAGGVVSPMGVHCSPAPPRVCVRRRRGVEAVLWHRAGQSGVLPSPAPPYTPTMHSCPGIHSPSSHFPVATLTSPRLCFAFRRGADGLPSEMSGNPFAADVLKSVGGRWNRTQQLWLPKRQHPGPGNCARGGPVSPLSS